MVQTVTSRTDLREKLNGRNSGGVFLTTIHKFNEDTDVLTREPMWFVFRMKHTEVKQS